MLLEISCGAEFLANRPRNAPLSFAPTQTRPKKVNFMAPTPDQPDYILPGPDQNNLISTQNKQVSDYNKHVSKLEYTLQWSNNMMHCANQG